MRQNGFSLIDVLPTLANLAAVPDLDRWVFKGRDLTPILANPAAEMQDVLHFTYKDFYFYVSAASHIRAIVEKRWKYAVYYDIHTDEPFEYEMYATLGGAPYTGISSSSASTKRTTTPGLPVTRQPSATTTTGFDGDVRPASAVGSKASSWRKRDNRLRRKSAWCSHARPASTERRLSSCSSRS